MSWLDCTDTARRHWGRYGAAGLLVATVVDDASYVLLDRRADWVHQGGTIGVPGGALDAGERPIEGALRELHEELAGAEELELDVIGQQVDPCPMCTTWSYTTIVARTPRPVEVTPRTFESAGAMWVPVDDVERLTLHPGFAAAWPRLRRSLPAAGR